MASQQGKYIGKKLHKLARQSSNLKANSIYESITDETVSKPFQYFHLGSLAYIGNAAVFDLGGYSFMGGLAAMYAWRSVYWNEQVSARTRALLMIDWIVRYVVLFPFTPFLACVLKLYIVVVFGVEIFRFCTRMSYKTLDPYNTLIQTAFKQSWWYLNAFALSYQ